MPSRVRSSGVGPRPPLVTTRSTRPSAAVMASAMVSRSSGSCVMRRTSTPRSVSERARSPLLVSRVSPTSSSAPMARSSAEAMGEASDDGTARVYARSSDGGQAGRHAGR